MSGISPGMKVIVPSGPRSVKGPPVRGTIVHRADDGGKEWWVKLDEPQDFGNHGWFDEDEVEAIIGESDD